MNQPNFNFDTLSPDVIWHAIASVGVRAESGFLPLNSYENRVYQFTDEERRRFVVKFYRPERWSQEQILEEHAFSIELNQAEIPIVAPVNLAGQTLHYYQGFYFALFPSVGGRQFEVDNENQLEWVGRYLGRIHKMGQQSLFIHRPDITLDDYLYRSQKTLENSSFIPNHLEKAFFNDLQLVISSIEKQWNTNWLPIRLHGDCHPGNILWRDEPIFVDLDDARNGPAIQDLWMLLNGERQEKLIQLDILLEGYQEFCDFNASELKLIEPLRGLRIVHYMAWLAKRWHDPAFPIAFPWFNEPKYWENQVLAFKEQIAALEEPSLMLSPQW